MYKLQSASMMAGGQIKQKLAMTRVSANVQMAMFKSIKHAENVQML